MEVRVDLARIIISDNADQQIIVLKERDGERSFSIVIGENEALAIDRRIKGIRTARPMTHDLMAGIIEQLHGDLERIVINDLKDHTFFARLYIRHGGEMVEVDSRPSDAIALGVASETPIYVEEHVLREVC
ncbi:MAG: bifunctional nuclease family protein [Phycisphaerae bacterium]|nr:bifunctional nuclease family protein [Phycisphaerae bacterium]NUQ46399.1 bifunctional nuclease family protein [Phycisphaerae bacterium]